MKNLLLVICLGGLLYARQETQVMVADSIIQQHVKEADAVVLSDDNIVTVDDSEIIYTVKKRIQINNKNGDHYDRVILNEREFVKVYDIEAKIMDILGLNEKKLEDDDIEEFTYSSGYQINAKAFDGSSRSYPYIIDYSYTIEYETHLWWPDWQPQKDIPVLSSSYKLILEDDIDYKTHKIGFDFEPDFFEEDGRQVHLYSVRNIPPLDYESYIPNEFKVQNAVLFAPLKFRFGESEGSFQSWDEFASWVRYLYNGRDILPVQLAAEIKNLVAGENDPYKKIEILYKYLQDKTRYVQIYMDIGGYQPHPAEWVYNNRFGDCKDLAVFMIAMLKVADIKSYPALVMIKDDGYVIKEFPSQQFNHVIAFIPMPGDTLWVDCTLDYSGYKDTPQNLQGTHALVVMDDHAEMLTIPQRKSSENLQQAIIRGALDTNGNLKISGNIISKGSIKNYYIHDLAVLKRDELKRSLIRDFTRYQPNFSLENFGFQNDRDDESVQLVFMGEYNKFSRKVGKRLFLNPNIINRETQNYVPDKEERTYPFDLVKFPYLDIDSLQIQLPQNYTIESAPEMKNLVYPFGKYITAYKIDKGVFYYKRLFEYSVELIYPEEFAAFLEFYRTVVETDKSKFVLKEL